MSKLGLVQYEIWGVYYIVWALIPFVSFPNAPHYPARCTFLAGYQNAPTATPGVMHLRIIEDVGGEEALWH